MKSIIAVIEFMETLEEDEFDTSYKSIQDMKEELKTNLFNMFCEQYKEDYEKKKVEKKKQDEKEKYIRLQKEREEEGEVCRRCSRRDCCCK